MDDDEEEKAATKIQARFRGHRTRNAIKEKKLAATKIQARFRGHRARKKKEEEELAAIKIQARFRGHRMRKKHQKRTRARDLWKQARVWVKRFLRDDQGAKNVQASRMWTKLATKLMEARNPTPFSLSYCLTTSYNSRRKVALMNLKLKHQISKQQAFIDNKLSEVTSKSQ